MFSAFKVFLFLGFRKINFKLSQLVVVNFINIKHLKIYSWRINFVIFLLTKLANEWFMRVWHWTQIFLNFSLILFLLSE